MKAPQDCKCSKCGYEWTAKVEDPKSCPSCKQYNWQQPNETETSNKQNKLKALLNCAEADLFGLISDYMDLDPETAEIPQAQTWREIKEYLEEMEKC